MKSLTAKELKDLYLGFFKKKKHVVIENASLVPKGDPTVLFTTAGMHPLVPYLLGKSHPKGKRLTDIQRCVRTGDIDSVGDMSHMTFFEMLGNWSLGDYFKKEAIGWSYEFLTEVLKIDPNSIYVTCFEGNDDAPKDTESAELWQAVGIPKDRIFFLPREDNWWGPAGETGPCGPDTEIFVDTGKEVCGKKCKPGCGCGKYFEVWNNVFMQYNKTSEGKYIPLKQKNVDTGMGVERTVAILNGKQSVYDIDVIKPIVEKVKSLAKNEDEGYVKIIVDHVRAAVFIIADGIVPSNLGQGYVLRRLIRRSIRYARRLGIEGDFTKTIAREVIKINGGAYPHLVKNESNIISELELEYGRFSQTLVKGLNTFKKFSNDELIDGPEAFLLFQSYGFPLEMTEELAAEKGIRVDVEGFKKEYEKHQEISRKGTEQKFKGGLVDGSEQTARMHTAAHLLAQALRDVLGGDVMQRGSNVSSERLRYDFSFDRKLTKEERQEVEDIVNGKIKESLPVTFVEKSLDEARELGAIGVFEHKYGEKVRVYFIGDYSKEICGGPHTSNTSNLGHFKIKKEEASSSGVRRIKAVLD
ncbi:MAG: alanine--tRNA ligase [archaeon]